MQVKATVPLTQNPYCLICEAVHHISALPLPCGEPYRVAVGNRLQHCDYMTGSHMNLKPGKKSRIPDDIS